MPTPPPMTLEFELCVRKTSAATKDMPDKPNGFKPLRGSAPAVTAEANRLNAVQNGLAQPYYFFFPEATPVDYDRLHCAMCKRVAVREAAADD